MPSAERAVREALDAIEAALIANGPSDNRHHLAHIQIVHPDDIPRFRRLGAVANGQPLWAAHEAQMDDLTIPFLGDPSGHRGSTRSRASCAPAPCSRSGATGASRARTRSGDARRRRTARCRPTYAEIGARPSREVFIPEERIDLATAIAAFTMGSAYVNHLDRLTGSIEVGKYADLAVIDQNLFDIRVG